MARPSKNYCEYFSHDRDMRNHRKVKAIRTKFGIQGYGLWSMILEYLTGIDNNTFEFSDVELELMAGDFGVSVTEIRDVIDYCIKLEMLSLNNGFIRSQSLDERLKAVYDKREKSKGNTLQQDRINGKFGNKKTETSVVSESEMPQSKVNKIKVNKSKENKKINYRDNIQLLFGENESLISDFGELFTNKCYDLLSSYKIEKNYKTKSDYLTIRRWVVDAVKKSGINPIKKQQAALKSDNREYWEIHYGHLGKTKEEIMQMVANGELD